MIPKTTNHLPDCVEYEIFHFIFSACLAAQSLQLCLTLCNPMDSSLPGSSVHGSLQVRMLEWVGDLPKPGIEPGSPASSALQADSLLLSHWGNPSSESQIFFSDFIKCVKVTLVVKNPPAVQEKQEIWVQSLGREDSLEEEMPTHSSILS